MELSIERIETLLLIAAIVAFSVFAQGLTLTPLLRRLKEIPEAGGD